MNDLKTIVCGVLAGLNLIGAHPAYGQTYPNKPIRMITSPVGGGSDLISRLIARGISAPLGQQVIVDNRGGVIPGEIVAKAPPDGYTLLTAAGSFWIEPYMHKISYDPLRDFAPVITATRSPNILVVNPSVPVKSVKELIALAKAKPGTLNFGSGGPGSNPHLSGELFKALAGINIMHVPYNGLGPALTGLMSNDVQIAIGSATSILPLMKSGKLLALAVTSPTPSALVPSLPILAEVLPGYEAGLLVGILAPSKTPYPVIQRLNREINSVLQKAEIKEKILTFGAEAMGGTPEQFTAAIKGDMARWGKVIKDAGIGVE